MPNNEQNESILNDVKKSLGLSIEDTSFDNEISMHINGALDTLIQLGVGSPLLLVGDATTWGDFMPVTPIPYSMIGMVKMVTFLKVKVLFDPPAPSTLGVMTSTIDEMVWRLCSEYNQFVEEVYPNGYTRSDRAYVYDPFRD